MKKTRTTILLIGATLAGAVLFFLGWWVGYYLERA